MKLFLMENIDDACCFYLGNVCICVCVVRVTTPNISNTIMSVLHYVCTCVYLSMLHLPCCLSMLSYKLEHQMHMHIINYDQKSVSVYLDGFRIVL